LPKSIDQETGKTAITVLNKPGQINSQHYKAVMVVTGNFTTCFKFLHFFNISFGLFKN